MAQEKWNSMVKLDNFVESLSVGMKVKCKLDTYDQSEDWFTGIIHNISGRNVDIRRDDEKKGGGRGSTWSTVLTNENMHLLKIISGDWDE